MEIFPISRAMQKGLIDQDTGLVILEAQLAVSGRIIQEAEVKFTLEEALDKNIIDRRTFQHLQELNDAVQLLDDGSAQNQLLPAVAAIHNHRIGERVGLSILEYHLATGGLRIPSHSDCLSLEKALEQGRISLHLYSALLARQRSSNNLIDPNTAKKVSMVDLMQQCVTHQESGQRLLPVKHFSRGMVCLPFGKKVSIFRAVKEGLIESQVTVRLLDAQLFAGGIVDPRTGHRLTVEEAVHHHLIDQDMAYAIFSHQLRRGGIVDTATGQRLTIDEAVEKGVLRPRVALLLLESLQPFIGLLFPESGDILPVSDTLQQGVLTNELLHKILKFRQCIQGLYLADSTEVLSWDKAVERGIVEREFVKKLKSTLIPDVIPNAEKAELPYRSSTLGRPAERFSALQFKELSKVEHNGKLHVDDVDWLMVYLRSHSCINIHNGQRVLLVDSELNDVVHALAHMPRNGCTNDEIDLSKDAESGEETLLQTKDQDYESAHATQHTDHSISVKDNHRAGHLQGDTGNVKITSEKPSSSCQLKKEKFFKQENSQKSDHFGKMVDDTISTGSRLQSRVLHSSNEEEHSQLSSGSLNMLQEVSVNTVPGYLLTPVNTVFQPHHVPLAGASQNSLVSSPTAKDHPSVIVSVGATSLSADMLDRSAILEDHTNTAEIFENQNEISDKRGNRQDQKSQEEQETKLSKEGRTMSGVLKSRVKDREKSVLKAGNEDSVVKQDNHAIGVKVELLESREKEVVQEHRANLGEYESRVKSVEQEIKTKVEGGDSIVKTEDQESGMKGRDQESKVNLEDHDRKLKGIDFVRTLAKTIQSSNASAEYFMTIAKAADHGSTFGDQEECKVITADHESSVMPEHLQGIVLARDQQGKVKAIAHDVGAKALGHDVETKALDQESRGKPGVKVRDKPASFNVRHQIGKVKTKDQEDKMKANDQKSRVDEGPQESRVRIGEQESITKVEEHIFKGYPVSKTNGSDQESKVHVRDINDRLEDADQDNKGKVREKDSRVDMQVLESKAKNSDQKGKEKIGGQELRREKEDQVSRGKRRDQVSRGKVGRQENRGRGLPQESRVEVGNQKGRMKAGDQETQVKARDQESQEKAGNQERQMKAEDKQSRVKSGNQVSQGKIGDQESRGKLEDLKSKGKTEDQEWRAKAEEQDSRVNAGDQDSHMKVGYQDSRVKVGDQDSRVKVGDQDSRVKVGDQDSRVKVGDQDSRVKVGDQDIRVKVGDQDSRAKVGDQDSRGKAVDQDSRGKDVGQDSRGKAIDQDSRGKAVDKDSRGKTVDQSGRGKAVDQSGREKAKYEERRVKVGNQENDDKVEIQEGSVDAGGQKSRIKAVDQAGNVRAGHQTSSMNEGDQESFIKTEDQKTTMKTGKLTTSSMKESISPEIITVESECKSSKHLGQSYEVGYYAVTEAFNLRHVSKEKVNSVGMLSEDFCEGDVTDELRQTLLMFEELAHGALPRHTAVKLLGKHSMFSGFFDFQIGESLTIQEVIEEGVMDEKLIQMILTSERSVSGVFDSHRNRILSIKDAANEGLLDTETTMRILEGQLVTGGIIDLKRNKRLSVTLASNLGIIDSSSQAELIKLEKALKGKCTDEATLVKLVGLQMETQGIRDTKTKEPVTIVQLIARGLLSKESAVCVLRKQIAEGGIVHQPSGIRLSVAKSLKHGLIDQDLSQALGEIESVCQHRYAHSSTTEPLSLKKAVSLSPVSAQCAMTLQEVEALNKGVLAPAPDQKQFLGEAADPGLLSKAAVYEEVSSLYFGCGIIDPESHCILPYLELMKKCKIDLETGQRYLELTPSGAVTKAVSGEVLPLVATVSASKGDLVSASRVLKDQVVSGSDSQNGSDKTLSLLLSSEKALVDEEKIKRIAEKLDTVIVDPLSDERPPLMQDISNQLRSHSSAASDLILGSKGEMVNKKSEGDFCVSGSSVVLDEMKLNNIQEVTQQIMVNDGLVDIKQIPKALLSVNQASLPPEKIMPTMDTHIINVISTSQERVESKVCQHATEPTTHKHAYGDAPSLMPLIDPMKSMAIDAIGSAGTPKTTHIIMEEKKEESHEKPSKHTQKQSTDKTFQNLGIQSENQANSDDGSSHSKQPHLLQKSNNEKLSQGKADSLTANQPNVSVKYALEKQTQMPLSKDNHLQPLDTYPSDKTSQLLMFTIDKQLPQEEMSQPTQLLDEHSVKEPQVQQSLHEKAESLPLKHPKKHGKYSKEKLIQKDGEFSEEKPVVLLDELATEKLKQPVKKSMLEKQSDVATKIKMAPKAGKMPNEKADKPCNAAGKQSGKKMNEQLEKSKVSKQEKSSTKYDQQAEKKLLEQSKPSLSEYSQQGKNYHTEIQASNKTSSAVQQRQEAEKTALDKKLKKHEPSNKNPLKKAVLATEKPAKQQTKHSSQMHPVAEQQMSSSDIKTRTKSEISAETLEIISLKENKPLQKSSKSSLSKQFLEKTMLSKQHETPCLEEFQITKPPYEEKNSLEKNLNLSKSSTEVTHAEKYMKSCNVKLLTHLEQYSRDEKLKQSQETNTDQQPLQPEPLSCDSVPPQQSKESSQDNLYQEPKEYFIDELFHKPDASSKGTQPQELDQLPQQSELFPRHNLLQQQRASDWKNSLQEMGTSSTDKQSQHPVTSLSDNLLPPPEKSSIHKPIQGQEQSFRDQLSLQSGQSSSDKQLKEMSCMEELLQNADKPLSNQQSEQEVPFRGLRYHETEASSIATDDSSKDRLLQHPEESSVEDEPQQVKPSLMDKHLNQQEKSDKLLIDKHPQQPNDFFDYSDQLSEKSMCIMSQSSLGEREAISDQSQDLSPRQDSYSVTAIRTESQMQETTLEYSRVNQTITKQPKELCLEHDAKLLSYLSQLQDIEVRMRPTLQQSSAGPLPVQELVQQAESYSKDLPGAGLPFYRAVKIWKPENKTIWKKNLMPSRGSQKQEPEILLDLNMRLQATTYIT